MTAIEAFHRALIGPDGNLSRSDYNAKAHALAMQWPSLAAAVAELLTEHSMPVPGPLRHAQNVMRQEKRP
jgi:hypothetical protein